jgi:hypothetical protein
MRTETGFEIPDEKVNEIKQAITELPKEEIDQIFHEAGFIMSDVPGQDKNGYNALTPEKLERIKNGSYGMVENLLRESDKEAIKQIVNHLDIVLK